MQRRLLIVAHLAHWSGPLFLALLLLALGTTPAAADPGQNASADQSTTAQTRRSADFFFGEPRGSITLRGGWIFASAGSDLFEFVQRNLTIDEGDFNAPAFGLDVAASLTPRMDLVVGMEFSKPSIASEYRDLVDNNFLPITQNTSLREINLTGSLKFALVPRGRSVSRFAWVPNGVIPYAGAGGGVLHYNFQQFGDFVDYQDMSVFTDSFISKGWAPTAHVFGGVDLQMYKSLFLSFEGRYLWGSGKLGRDFIDFDPIDLAGFRVSAGAQLVF